MLPRIVFIVLALFVMWRVLSALGKRRVADGFGADSFSRFSPRERGRRRGLERDPSADSPEELVRCAKCGTYVPQGGVLPEESGGAFCSRSCRDEFEGRNIHEA